MSAIPHSFVYLGAKLPNKKYEKFKIENMELISDLKAYFSTECTKGAFGGNFFVCTQFYI